MGYLHIDNLYKNQTILMFKECYALEKIHGTSAHISYNGVEQKLNFFSGGESYEKFVSIFNVDFLLKKFIESFGESKVVIFGEAYGGKQHGMSATYGKTLKFIGFDVRINECWLNVPNVEDVCNSLGIEFVDYIKVSTDLDVLNAERDKQSIQAIRNGCGEGKLREGVVLKPLIEVTTNNGNRIIVKHKRDEFKETKTPREVSPKALKIMEDAKAIAEEYVTEMRLKHVLDKLPQEINVESTKLVIDAMIEDVYREAKGEIVESKEVIKFIGSKTALMFKNKLKNEIK
jgi:hypothetical protein